MQRRCDLAAERVDQLFRLMHADAIDDGRLQMHEGAFDNDRGVAAAEGPLESSPIPKQIVVSLDAARCGRLDGDLPPQQNSEMRVRPNIIQVSGREPTEDDDGNTLGPADVLRADRIALGPCFETSEPELSTREVRLSGGECPILFGHGAEFKKARRLGQAEARGQVTYRGWTHDDRLRHASFKGLREKPDEAKIYRVG